MQEKEDEINYKFSQQKLFEHENTLLKNKLTMVNKVNKDMVPSTEFQESSIKSYFMASHIKSSKKSPLTSFTEEKSIFTDRTNSDYNDSSFIHNLTPTKKKKLF